MNTTTETIPQRIADHPINPIFLNRWSPRAYTAEPMPESDLLMMLEAARWAPSAFNIQPWRFLYSLREDGHWQQYLSQLDPFNAGWAQHAAALIVLLSHRLTPASDGREAKPSRSHSFDAGAAWAQLALQATAMGYQAHAMGGVHFVGIREHLNIPDHYRVEIAIAIGKNSDPSQLSEQLRAREQPSGRCPLNQIAFPGKFSS